MSAFLLGILGSIVSTILMAPFLGQKLQLPPALRTFFVHPNIALTLRILKMSVLGYGFLGLVLAQIFGGIGDIQMGMELWGEPYFSAATIWTGLGQILLGLFFGAIYWTYYQRLRKRSEQGPA
jgi:hypothetical protein